MCLAKIGSIWTFRRRKGRNFSVHNGAQQGFGRLLAVVSSCSAFRNVEPVFFVCFLPWPPVPVVTPPVPPPNQPQLLQKQKVAVPPNGPTIKKKSLLLPAKIFPQNKSTTLFWKNMPLIQQHLRKGSLRIS